MAFIYCVALQSKEEVEKLHQHVPEGTYYCCDEIKDPKDRTLWEGMMAAAAFALFRAFSREPHTTDRVNPR